MHFDIQNQLSFQVPKHREREREERKRVQSKFE